MKLISYLVLIPIHIGFIRFAIVGTVLRGYRHILVCKRIGV